MCTVFEIEKEASFTDDSRARDVADRVRRLSVRFYFMNGTERKAGYFSEKRK